jgi:hypothetical protein
MDGWMISFTLTSRFWRYTGYSNYIYPCMYMCNVPLPENELGASSRPIVARCRPPVECLEEELATVAAMVEAVSMKGDVRDFIMEAGGSKL